MFGIGFCELALIILVGLAILGPERCVKSTKKISLWFTNFNREFDELKKDLSEKE